MQSSPTFSVSKWKRCLDAIALQTNDGWVCRGCQCILLASANMSGNEPPDALFLYFKIHWQTKHDSFSFDSWLCDVLSIDERQNLEGGFWLNDPKCI